MKAGVMKLRPMQRILITGGAGFIGSHLVEVLLACGHEVVVLDDLSTGHRSNLPALNPKLRFVEGSILDPTAIESSMEQCNAVIHLAAVASVQATFAAPQITHGINVTGTIACLEGARAAGASRFIFASSAAVYGNATRQSISEEDACSPQSPYAVDKLACEMYGRILSAKWGIKFLALRFFNVYGPGQSGSSDYSGVVQKFSEAAIFGTPALIFGDGLQSRDFIFVRDLAETIGMLVDGPDMTEQTLNVGTGRSTSILDLVTALEAITGRQLKVEHVAPLNGDIRHSQADIRRLRELNGAQFQTNIQDGLGCLVESLRVNRPE